MNRPLRSSYHAYLLRCWQESEGESDGRTWRFSLEGVQDSQRRGFANLESLLAYLQRITQTGSNVDAHGRPDE